MTVGLLAEFRLFVGDCCDGFGRVLADAFVVSEGVFNGIVGEVPCTAELRVGTETVEVSGGSWWPVPVFSGVAERALA